MILTVAFVALLLGAQAQAGGKAMPECKEWACFISKRCLNYAKDELQTLNEDPLVNDDCSGIIMIRPYSSKQWMVVLESRNSATTEVKVSQDSTELFACKKEGSKSVPSSTLPGFKEQPNDSTLPLSCKFFVGDGSTDVIKPKAAKIKLVSDAINVEMKDGEFIMDSLKKTTCDVGNVKFETSDSAEEVFKAATVSLETVSCADPFKLQYKSGGKYVDVIGDIKCTGTNPSPNDYKYVVTTADGEKDESGPFQARCHAKVCSFCSALASSSTTAGKTAPVFNDTNEDGCKTLTCAKFFEIGDAITDEKATCTKGDVVGSYVWKVGETKLDASTTCVETKQCKGTLNCNGKQLIAKLNTKKFTNITCDNSRGQLTYSEDGATVDLPDSATFNCTDIQTTPEEKIATGGSGIYMPGPLAACLAVATILSLLLVALSLGLHYWRKRNIAAKAAEAAKSKSKKEGKEDKKKAKADEKEEGKEKSEVKPVE